MSASAHEEFLPFKDDSMCCVNSNRLLLFTRTDGETPLLHSTDACEAGILRDKRLDSGLSPWEHALYETNVFQDSTKDDRPDVCPRRRRPVDGSGTRPDQPAPERQLRDGQLFRLERH